jgi:outer membrane protein insertion porin family
VDAFLGEGMNNSALGGRLSMFVVIFCLCSVGQGVFAQDLGDNSADEDKDLAEEIQRFGSADIKGQTVIRVETEGNRRVSSDDVRVNIGTRRGMTLDSARVARDIRALYGLGFFSDVQVSVSSVEGGVVLKFKLVEKAAVSEVKLEGNDDVDEDDIKEVLDIQANKPLDVPTIHRNLQKIRDLYSKKGFFLAQASYRLEETGENTYDVIFVIRENAEVEVRRFDFVGNREISDAEIARVLSTRTAGPLSALTDSGKFAREDFDRDLTVIQALYWEKGYLNVKVGTPRVELTADRRYIFLSVPIEEGPRFKVGRIAVREVDENGKEIEPLDGRRAVRAMVQTKRDEWFANSAVRLDVERVQRHYQDKGYAHVNVDLQTLTRRDADIVDLALEISRGPLVYFERIEVRGNTKTRDRVIRREIPIHEGEKYSQTGIDISKARVTQLGFFESVDVTTRPGSASESVIVTVEVTEKHTGQFQVGMGFSSVENFIAQAQITEQNFLGQGQTVSLQAQISSMRQMFMLSFWEPRFLDSQWTLAFNLYNTVMSQIDFNRTSTGAELTLGHPLVLRDLRLYLTYTIEHSGVDVGSNRGLLISGRRLNSDLYNLPLANLFKDGLTSSVKAMVAFDKRNNRLFPTAGSYNMGSVEYAPEWLGTEDRLGFTRYSLTSRWYFPLFWKFVLRLNGQWGLITSHEESGLSIMHRYRSGGIMDVRGFYPWSIGPRLSIPAKFDPNAEPVSSGINIGGNMRLTFNTEIEFPIIEMVGIKGVVFFDAGNAFNLEKTWCQAGGEDSGRGINKYSDPCWYEDPNIFLLRTSAGFGFRWFSPMGPLRFEWGFPLKRFAGEERQQFEFTFGNFF